MDNRIRSVLASGETAWGAWVQMANPESVEFAGLAGFDFVLIDREHGSFGLDTTAHLVRAAAGVGITPIVRVPSRDPLETMRALDAGALGVLVPGVSTPQQALESARAARYAPDGNRGACPFTLATIRFQGDWTEFTEWSNRTVTVWLLIEGEEGIGNIDRILETPGVDAICLGPFDLAQALGVPGQTDHPRVVQALQETVAKARDHGVEVVAVPFSRTTHALHDEVARWTELGCRIVAGGVDRLSLRDGLSQAWSAMTGKRARTVT